MRFSVQLPTDRVEYGAEFVSGEAVAECARAAEAAGFDAAFVTDHPVPDDRWLAAGGHHTVDPFVALSFAAAATEGLRLQTNVLVLPYRNPFLVAKAAASLDALSGGRLILGVAAGYLESEFAALGVDFAERNELSDEAIIAIKRAWGEEGVAMRGRHFEAAGNTQLPRPVQKPHPPIWVGGNSRRAIRRAVELADGWLPFPAPRRMAAHIRTASIESLEDLEARIGYAREHAAAVGRSAPLDIGFVPFGFEIRSMGAVDAAQLHESVASLHALGVTWVAINVPCRSRSEYRDRVGALGEAIRADAHANTQ
ncbi:MAG: LLM class F420-dependent oxidoreductase [Proteobacteria bacterium]|nr:LLM class F420-dependent oxidoreductase [Pseudomonadota bacterium]